MRIIMILMLLVSASQLNAQEVWGNVDKNKVTMSEIPPIWPGCTGDSAPALSKCFNTNLAKHIAANFKYPAAEYNNNIQGKVIVSFVINTEGKVEVKSVSGGNEALQAEAKRNIMQIPQMQPGMLAGKPREIAYKVPFTFKTGRN